MMIPNRHRRRRPGVAPLVATLLLVGGLVFAGPARAQQKVNFWAVRDPQNSTQLSLAKHLGYFKEVGLDVDIRWVISFSDLYAPAGAGQVDFTVTSVNNGLKWRADNIPMRYLAILTDIAGGQGVVINPGAIKRPADFEKAKIGMATGSTVELAVQGFAKAHGLDVKRFQFVNLQPPDQLSEFSRGGVQAIAVWQPWLHRATTEFGGKLYFNGATSYIGGGETPVDWLRLPSGVLASTALIEQRPEVARSLLKALVRADEYAARNPKEAARLIAEDMKVAPQVMEALILFNRYSPLLDAKVLEDIQRIADWLIATKKLKAKVDPLALFDVRFLKDVAPQYLKVGR